MIGAFSTGARQQVGAHSVIGIVLCSLLHKASYHYRRIAGNDRSVTGIFVTGGDQGRIVRVCATRPAATRSFMVGGTIAGASAMSEIMVAGGDVHPVPSRGVIELRKGLGLIRGVIGDQHFSERRRIGCLVTVISQDPRMLGLGVDEDTAAIIGPGRILEVVGEHTVTLFDGTEITDTNADGEPDGPISVIGMKLRILLP